MKKSKPVIKYQEFINENVMKKKQGPNKIIYTPNPNTPLLNLLHEYGFTMTIKPKSDSRFGNECESIRVGYDWNSLHAFMVEIKKVYTEEMIADNYGDDWQKEPEALAELGTVIEGEDLTFNFFTNAEYSNTSLLQEEALRYAQKFYKMYQNEKIDVNSYLELIGENEKLQFFLKFTGVNIKSNQDIELLTTACYRAYQDSKCMYEAGEFLGAHFLHDFKNAK